jgi:1,4-dihydroxy-2-naphthoyl-CoA hydrolase
MTTFDRYIGMDYIDYQEDQEGEEIARQVPGQAQIKIEPHHCNPTGNINGGVIISLADNISTGAAGRAYFEKTGEQKFMVGVDLHAVMLSNQQGGTIRGYARPVRVGRRITVIRTEILGEDDKLLAAVTTTHVPT